MLEPDLSPASTLAPNPSYRGADRSEESDGQMVDSSSAIAHDFHPAQETNPASNAIASTSSLEPLVEQLEITGLPTSPPTSTKPTHPPSSSNPKLSWQQERQLLLDELARFQAQERHRVERIFHLEQALDQSLASLEDVKQRLRDQEILEAQLVNTEEFSSIQQWVIHSLKQQLFQCQQALATLEDPGQVDRLGAALLADIEGFILAQQAEFDRVKAQLLCNRNDSQGRQQQLEKQIAALKQTVESQQQQMMELEAQELTARRRVAALELQLQDSRNKALRAPQGRQIPPLSLDGRLVERHPDVAVLQQELTTTRNRVEELQAQISRHSVLQARLQHTCEELQEERDRHLQRVNELQHQTAEMQEQVLQQVRVIAEYETAVQHWKDRCITAHEHLVQLKEVLERMFPDRSAELNELLNLIHPVHSIEADAPQLPRSSGASRAIKPLKVDLPTFLARYRNQKS